MTTSSSPSGPVSILDFGASTSASDNRASIQRAFDYAAANGVSVLIPAGTFAYSGVITARGIAVSGVGVASVLKALDVANESLELTGSGGSISNLRMVSNATARLSSPWSAMIWANGAQNYSIQNVTIDGSSSVGIFNQNSTNGHILNNTVQGTLADSITAIDGSSYLTIQGNRVLNAGDDGISIVSYDDHPIDHDITIQGNTVLNNLSGRGITVVGGNNVTIAGNHVEGGPAGVANIYIGSEAQWSTLGVDNVSVTGNTLMDGGGAPSGTGQGAITIFNNRDAYSVTNLVISGNQIVAPRNTALQYVGSNVETGTVQGNSVFTLNPAWGLSNSGNPTASFTTTNNTVAPLTSYTSPLVPAGGGVQTTTTTPGTAVPPTTTTDPSPPAIVPTHVLTLHLSEDYYRGNAKFIAKLDGTQLNTATAVTALHSRNHFQDFTFQGQWAAGNHNLEIDFVNDAYGGAPSLDRNLYVAPPTYDGHTAAGSVTALYSNGGVVIPIVSK